MENPWGLFKYNSDISGYHLELLKNGFPSKSLRTREFIPSDAKDLSSARDVENHFNNLIIQIPYYHEQMEVKRNILKQDISKYHQSELTGTQEDFIRKKKMVIIGFLLSI